MKLKIKSPVGLLCTGAMLMIAGVNLLADAKSNPFQVIVTRNPFGLTSPPRQDKNPTPQPEKPPAVIRLTGVTSVLPQKKALFEIAEAPGKPFKNLIMVEGERDGDIELLAIDIGKNQVTIKNGTGVTNITLEAVKSAPGAPVMASAPPGAPGNLPDRSNFLMQQKPVPPPPPPPLSGILR